MSTSGGSSGQPEAVGFDSETPVFHANRILKDIFTISDWVIEFRLERIRGGQIGIAVRA